MGKGRGKGLPSANGAAAYRGPPLTQQPKPRPQAANRAPKYDIQLKVPFDPEWLVNAAEECGKGDLAAALKHSTSGWWESHQHAYFHFIDPHTDAWKFAGNVELH